MNIPSLIFIAKEWMGELKGFEHRIRIV